MAGTHDTDEAPAADPGAQVGVNLERGICDARGNNADLLPMARGSNAYEWKGERLPLARAEVDGCIRRFEQSHVRDHLASSEIEERAIVVCRSTIEIE